MGFDLGGIRDYLGSEPLVDMQTFIEDPDYLGLTEVYPFWLDCARSFTPDISTVALTGSLGGGKTTYANILTCRRLYEWFSQGDLYKYFGLLQGSPLYFLYFSVSLKAAERSGFKQLRSMIDNSVWFRKHFPADTEIRSSIRFANGLNIEYASGESHAIGLNVIGAELDEANFRKGVGGGAMSEYSEVQQLAQQLEDRMHARFTRHGGKLLSFMCYISSASYSSSFMEDKLKDLEGDPHALIHTAVQYKICPSNYSSKTFEVFCGYDQITPCIVTSREQRATLVRSTGLPRGRADGLFERVPVDLLSSFKKNIWLAIQNHCGRATAIRGTFITNYELVRDSYVTELYAARPLLQDSIVVSNGDDIALSTVFDESKFIERGRPRAIAIDLSLSGDSASITSVRFDGLGDDGRPVHTHEFTLELVPPAFPNTLKISKVEDLIYWLAERINIYVVATDQFQSASLRQNIQERLGLPDIRFSIDATDIPHLMWLGLLTDGRLRMQFIPRLDREIREAVHDVQKHKVVKRSGSSDDMFQTVVSAAFLCETMCTKGGDISSLLDATVNLSSTLGIERIMNQLGYTGMSMSRYDYGSGISTTHVNTKGGIQYKSAEVSGGFTSGDVQRMVSSQRVSLGFDFDALNVKD